MNPTPAKLNPLFQMIPILFPGISPDPPLGLPGSPCRSLPAYLVPGPSQPCVRLSRNYIWAEARRGESALAGGSCRLAGVGMAPGWLSGSLGGQNRIGADPERKPLAGTGLLHLRILSESNFSIFWRA